MHKLNLLIFSILLPLSIKAQNPKIIVTKDSFYRIVLGRDSTAFFMIEEDGFPSVLSFKISDKSTMDTIQKGLIPTQYQQISNDFKAKTIKKSFSRDSMLKAWVHKPIPDFDAPDTLGFVHRPEQYRGRVLILHFFNFWDFSFQNEIPVLNNLVEKYGKNGLEVLSFTDIPISSSERKVLKEKPILFPLVANSRHFMDKFLPIDKRIPYLVIVDKKGHFRHFYLKNELLAEKTGWNKEGVWERERIKTDFGLEEKITKLLEEY